MFRRAERSVEVLAANDLLEGGVLALLNDVLGSVQVDIVTDRLPGERPSRFGIHILPLAAPCEVHPTQGKLLPYERSGVFLVDDARTLLWLGSSGEQPSALYSESAGFVQFVRRHIASVTERARAAGQ